MVSLGEGLEDLGFPHPLQDIEGHGLIGRSCQNCRSDAALKVVAYFLKDLVKTMQKLTPKELDELSVEKADVVKAIQLCAQAWNHVKKYADERTDEQKKKDALRAQQQRGAPPKRR